MTSVNMEEAADVKYLTFVKRGAESIYELAESAYGTVRSKALQVSPTKVQELVAGAEERLSPVWGSTCNLSLTLLKFADSLVDAATIIGSDAMASVQGQGKSAVEGIKLRVQKTLDNEMVTDVKNSAQAKYSSAHGAIISNPAYAQLYQTTINYVKWLSSIPVVQKSSGMVYSTAYPRLKPVVDPVITKVEPYVKALEEHLEPKTSTTSPMAVSEASTKSKRP